MTSRSLNLVCKATYVEVAHIDAANIDSNEGSKSELYYQLGIGLYRIGDSKGAKKALEVCLKIDRTLWEARNLLENVELALDGKEANEKSKSTLLKYVVVAFGLAIGFASVMFHWEKLDEFVGGIKKAGELGESIETMIVTRKDSYPTGTSSVVAHIVGAAFLIGLKKSSSG